MKYDEHDASSSEPVESGGGGGREGKDFGKSVNR